MINIDKFINNKYIKDYRSYNKKHKDRLIKEPGFFRINDIYLSIPPEAIQVNENYDVRSFSYLRNATPIYTPAGYGEITVNFSVLFTNDTVNYISASDEVRYKLIPLITQLKKMPILQVESDYLRNRLSGIELFRNYNDTFGSKKGQPVPMMFATQHVNIETEDGNPGAFRLNISMMFFNYRPYVSFIRYPIYPSSEKSNAITTRPEDSVEFYKFFEADFTENSLATSGLPFYSNSLTADVFQYINYPKKLNSKSDRKNLNFDSNKLLKDDLVFIESAAENFRHVPLNLLVGMVRLADTVPYGIGKAGVRGALLDALHIEIGNKGQYLGETKNNLMISARVINKLIRLTNNITTALQMYHDGTSNPHHKFSAASVKYAEKAQTAKATPPSQLILPTQSQLIRDFGETDAEKALKKLQTRDPKQFKVVKITQQYVTLQIRKVIPIDTNEFTIDHLSYSFMHNIAIQPIAGEVFPTIQHTGKGEQSLSVAMTAHTEGGHSEMSRLTGALELYETYAQNFKFVSRTWGIQLHNPTLENVFGITNCVLKEISSNISANNPNITNIKIALADSSNTRKEVEYLHTIQNAGSRVTEFGLHQSYIKALVELGSIYFINHKPKSSWIRIASLPEADVLHGLISELVHELRPIYDFPIGRKHESEMNWRILEAKKTGLKQARQAGNTEQIPLYEESIRELKRFNNDAYIISNKEEDLKAFIAGGYQGVTKVEFGIRIKNFINQNKHILFGLPSIQPYIQWATDTGLDFVIDYPGSAYKDFRLPLDNNPDQYFGSDNERSRLTALDEKWNAYRKQVLKSRFNNYTDSMESTALLNDKQKSQSMLWSSYEQSKLDPTSRAHPDNFDNYYKNPGPELEGFDTRAGMPSDFLAKDYKCTNKVKSSGKSLVDDFNQKTSIEHVNEKLPEQDENSLVDYSTSGENGLLNLPFSNNESLSQPNYDKKNNPRSTMRRTFPTYKVYIIEDDLNDYIEDADEVFQLNAIQEIRVIRSREIAADLAIINFFDLTGQFTSARFKNGGGVREDKSLSSIDTSYENEFRGIMIQEGTTIKIRMGYDNDPQGLDTVFIGRVSGLESEGGNIRLVAQSYATELVAQPLGSRDGVDFTWGDADTQEILFSLICRPELRHFGKFKKTTLGYRHKNADGVVRFVASFVDRSNNDNILAPSWEPGRTIYESAKSLLFNGTFASQYLLIGQTVWDVFQEMTLRHPGYIAIPRYYDNIMTMYYGPSSGSYFYRGNTLYEENKYGNGEKLKKGNKILVETGPGGNNSINLLSSEDKQFNAKIKENKALKNKGRIAPIVKYHYAASNTDIISNNIRTDSRGVYTEARINYVNSANDAALGDRENDLNTVNVVMDDSLRKQDTMTKELTFPNCEGVLQGYRYGTGVLQNEARNFYKGELILQGNPSIEPYHKIIVSDSTTDMFGPIGVRQVEHVFTPRDGFVTVVTPDLNVDVNDYAAMGQMEAMWTFMTGRETDKLHTIHDHPSNGDTYVGTVAQDAAAVGVLAAVLSNPFISIMAVAALSWTGKIIRRAMFRQPLVMMPLMRSGVPYLYGLNSYLIQGYYQSFFDNFDRMKEGIGNFYDGYISQDKIGKSSETMLGNSLVFLENMILR